MTRYSLPAVLGQFESPRLMMGHPEPAKALARRVWTLTTIVAVRARSLRLRSGQALQDNDILPADRLRIHGIFTKLFLLRALCFISHKLPLTRGGHPHEILAFRSARLRDLRQHPRSRTSGASSTETEACNFDGGIGRPASSGLHQERTGSTIFRSGTAPDLWL